MKHKADRLNVDLLLIDTGAYGDSLRLYLRSLGEEKSANCKAQAIYTMEQD